jgi:hypothetical protein
MSAATLAALSPDARSDRLDRRALETLLVPCGALFFHAGLLVSVAAAVLGVAAMALRGWTRVAVEVELQVA